MGACQSKQNDVAVVNNQKMNSVKTNVKESSSSTQPSPLCTSDRTHPNSPEHTSLKIDPLNLPTEPPLIIDSPSPPNHHRNESTDSSYYSDTETSNGINTSPHAKRRTSRKNLTQSDSKLGLNDILSGDLKNPNLVRIEVPLGKPIEEVYEGVHDGPVLGSGISGIVRLCKHRTTQTEYAVKCLDLALIDSEEGLKQLKEEIYIMCQLDHPNIVRLEEVYESHSEIYLVQEVCKGGELFDRLDEQPDYHYTELQCARLVKQMLNSVTYIHNKGIIHRDLKLENFLFSDETAESELKMIDFGLSKHFTFGEKQHEAVGTPYTVAPEVIKGSYDERCDVWAVGVIAYLLLSGEPPFGGCGGPETLMQVRDNILRGTFRFEPEDIWETVSNEAKEFIKSLLVLDPMQRPTAKEAKESKWVKCWRNKENGDEAPVINPNVVKALIGFKEYSDMRKLLCEVLSFTLLPEQIQGLRDEFEKYDQDGTGEITLTTLKKVLIGNAATGSLGGLTEDEVEDIFMAMRVRKGETTIHWHDFIAAGLSQCEVDDRNLKLAFERLDQEHKGYITFENVIELLGSDTFTSEDEILKMWGESMKDVNRCQKGGMCHITYEDFLLLMKGQKNVVNLRRSLEPLPEFSIEDEDAQGEEDENQCYISAEKLMAECTLPPKDIPQDLAPKLLNSTPPRSSGTPPPPSVFHRQGSISAPATPSHIGRRFQAVDQTDSPVVDENRVTFEEQVLSIPPLDLTPPQTPVRGPQDYTTPTAGRVLLNPQLLDSLRPPILSSDQPQPIPGYNALHESFSMMPTKGRSISLDEKDTFTAKMAAESRASAMFKRDSRRALAIPEHTHNISDLEKIIQDESVTPLVVNRRLYRAHREFRHSVTAACKRFEDEKLRRAMETLKARENELQSKHTAGLVMRHGQALNEQSIKNFLKKTMEEQQVAVDKANRRGGRGRSSRKKTISDMSGMLSLVNTPELPQGSEVPTPQRAVSSREPMMNERTTVSTDLPSVKENENLLRNPTKPGEFHKTNYDPFLQKKSIYTYGTSRSPRITALETPAPDKIPPLIPL